MKIVIQCAATKHSNAGRLRTKDGKPVEFVAHPNIAPTESIKAYARPDDASDRGISWREQLRNYNENQSTNPLGILPAYQLYENKVYAALVDRFGIENVYILSAGWGLIRSDFLTPYYDITFSQSADKYKRRVKADHYNDFRMLSVQTAEKVCFCGGKDYLPLFCELTGANDGERIAFFNSRDTPRIGNIVFKRFHTKTQTNWHYECAKALIDGKLSL